MAAAVSTKTNQEARFHLEWTDALAIISMFAMGTLVYGLFIPSLGFYWDDWPVVWVYNALGPAGLTKYFAGERPLAGWMYAHLAPIIGISPIGWHVLALALRCASSAVLFVAFRALWPKRRDVAWLVGAIVLLYPGFTQQPIGLNYLEQHLSFFLFVVSLAATILSMTTPAYRWLLLTVSLVTGGFAYLITEFFIGLELFRLFVIAVLTRREGIAWDRSRFKATLVAWSPYAALWIAYGVWRAFIFRAASTIESYKDVSLVLSSVRSNPIHEMTTRVSLAVSNILMSALIAWARPFNPGLVSLNDRSLHAWIIAAIVAAIAIFILGLFAINRESTDEARYPPDQSGSVLKTGFLLGVLGLGVAGLPLAAAGLGVGFVGHPSFPDRFTLPFMLPASLVLSCLLAFRRTKMLSNVLLVASILFVFSVYQIQNESLYRQDWLAQKSTFWQLAWRAPALKQGTSVFVENMPMSLYRNHSAGLLDLLYNSNDSAGRLDYFIFDLSRLSTLKPPWGFAELSYGPDDPVVGSLRSYQFHGTTAESLVSWISPNGTFRIVVPPYANEILRGSALSLNLSYLSQPEKVISDAGLPDGPLLKIFGPEPKHEWLYFYQKAELGRQLKHWEAIAMLGDEVLKRGYQPVDVSEWFPFIEGYANARRYRTAVDLSNRMLEECPDALPELSSLWLRVKGQSVGNSTELNDSLSVVAGKFVLRDSQ